MFLLHAIPEYEPRVIVQEIDFVQDVDAALDGKLIPSVITKAISIRIRLRSKRLTPMAFVFPLRIRFQYAFVIWW